jgi:arsenate reductase (thioredoxin)
MATVLFVCRANRGRSVMSQALFEQAAAGRHHAISAGSEAEPQRGPHPEVVEVMRELGIDVASQQPQRLTAELAAQVDAVVTMGCGDACPVIPGRRQLRLDWDLPDPKDRPIDEVRATRDDIRERVQDLVAELDSTALATA